MAKDKERFLFDMGSAVLLLAVALGGCYLPRYLAKRGKAAGNERSFIFQLGNMLSAGVMISAGFCHLLADAIKHIADSKDEDKDEGNSREFPLGPFLCATGFLITLSADQYAMWLSRKKYANEPMLLSTSVSKSDEPTTSGDPPSKRGYREASTTEPEDDIISRPLEVEVTATVREQQPRVSFLTAMFLGLALSLHSVLEGLALGSQQTLHSSEDVLIAIAAHKGLAAYALGASLVDSEATISRFSKVAVGFSVASPIGILVGFGVSKFAEGVVSASLSALASGTFLYVAMMEVIPAELESGENILYKLLIMFLGFSAMSILAIWA